MVSSKSDQASQERKSCARNKEWKPRRISSFSPSFVIASKDELASLVEYRIHGIPMQFQNCSAEQHLATLEKFQRCSTKKAEPTRQPFFFFFYHVKQEDPVGVKRFTPNTWRFLPPNLYTIALTELSAESSCIYRGSSNILFFFFLLYMSLCALFLSNQFPRSVS